MRRRLIAGVSLAAALGAFGWTILSAPPTPPTVASRAGPRRIGSVALAARETFARGDMAEVVRVLRPRTLDAAEPRASTDAWWILAHALTRLGDRSSAEAAWRRVLSVGEEATQIAPENPIGWYYLGWGRHGLGDEGGAQEAWRTLVARSEAARGGAGPRYDTACHRALVGDRFGALEALASAIDNGWNDRAWTLADPDLESLHGDPVFERLVARLPPAPVVMPIEGGS